jgi:cold-inducible RNA-binding protein
MNQQNQKLYVGNLNFDANEEQVRELFGTYGAVEDVKIVMDRFSGRSRGFAFVRMDSSESANKAKEGLNGQPFQGKTLVIDYARTEQERGSRPPMGDRGGAGRGGPSSEFRPRREWGGGGGDRGNDRGERREYRGGGDRSERGSDRGDRSGNFYNR